MCYKTKQFLPNVENVYNQLNHITTCMQIHAYIIFARTGLQHANLDRHYNVNVVNINFIYLFKL